MMLKGAFIGSMLTIYALWIALHVAAIHRALHAIWSF